MRSFLKYMIDCWLNISMYVIFVRVFDTDFASLNTAIVWAVACFVLGLCPSLFEDR